MRIYYVVTSDCDMLVSVNDNNECKYLVENEHFPQHSTDRAAFKAAVDTFIKEYVKDTTYWSSDIKFDELKITDILTEIEI